MTCIKTIFLDLDDVLVDCTGEVIRHMGISDFETWRDYPEELGRDVVAAYEKLTGIDYDVPTFWEHFKREFWAGMAPNPWLPIVLDWALRLVREENIMICTSPTKCGDCLAGKFDWIEKHLPAGMQRQFIITPRKHLCANPSTLLVDDCQENIDAFVEAGGKGIPFPALWNANRSWVHPSSVEDDIREFFEHVFDTEKVWW